MQSGITASEELRSAFNELVSTASQRGLLASIQGEALIPGQKVPSSSSSFLEDLSNLSPLLLPSTPAYILLRLENASDGFIAITYVPDTAPVRQKMLFASTRLTLVKELGGERFRETLFVTELKELERQGWEKHEWSKKLAAPLTEEEEVLRGVKEAEAQTQAGTARKRMHFGSGPSLGIEGSARTSLEGLRDAGSHYNLVQLRISPGEEIALAGTSSTTAEGLAACVSATEPRYSFFRYRHDDADGQNQDSLVFIYTCPSGSKVRDRMVYASAKAGLIRAAQDELGFEIAKKLEVSNPNEITAPTIEEEFRPKLVEKQGFARPKRPGRR